MLILINPDPDEPNKIWINPAHVVSLHPLRQKQSTRDPSKPVWVFSVACSDGQSRTVEFNSEELGTHVERLFRKALE